MDAVAGCGQRVRLLCQGTITLMHSFYMAVDPLLTFRSKNRNAKPRKNTHCHTHELISSLLIIAQPHTGLRAVTPAQLERDLSDWQLR